MTVVAILAGGLSHERDVSLRSGRRVAEALRTSGCETFVLDANQDMLPSITSRRPDVIWPLLHGATGEDGSMRDVLELIGIPYVGSRPDAARLGWAKPNAKALVARAGLAVPHAVAVRHDLFRDLGTGPLLDRIVERLGLPLVVKPGRGGSALGVTVVDQAAALPKALVDCYAYDSLAMLERVVDGIEVAVSVVDAGEPFALPAVEIVTEGAYDYDARYNPGRTQYFAPARLTPEVAEAAAGAALLAHRTLGLRHLSRTDLIIDPAGVPTFIEVNVAPGMTETSLFPQAALAGGHDLPTLYRSIVEAAARTV